MKFLLLGIGNVLFADEGIGVHFLHYMEENYRFSHPLHSLTLLDGGTLAQGLTPIISQFDEMLLVDTVNAAGANPGQVYFFDFDKAPAEIDWQGSAHEVEMLQTLTMMEMLGDRPKTWVLGVTPTRLEPMRLGLSPELLGVVPLMEEVVLKHLRSLGFEVERRQHRPIEELIPSAWQGQIPIHENS
ncbi:HyaD/HybD family hydrogenase maturation endopeptidase [Shewanella sedimentimangrovi]|uniref:HyaD/HybD family hydrogenase maturation endopeptidase n=1 Tax=Shewanella sedimentimangrovi TaxID=2814293 RepID=A0ABX7QX56_9GAMM|nr:HyaD/HybD family hydrogenase maturation endopeptidase [Shewanella sedimentimangrovi]QSX35632.1 HyaD/HybD family hydrogenase maturation endopeptidase [Shewanella sedimentimangrovi]